MMSERILALAGGLLLDLALLAIGVGIELTVRPQDGRLRLSPTRLGELMLYGLGGAALLAVPFFALRLPLDLYVGCFGGLACVGLILMIRRWDEVTPFRRSELTLFSGVLGCFWLLAVGTSLAAALLVPIRLAGGDEIFHLARIRKLCLLGEVSLHNPYAVEDGVYEASHFMPLFHLLGAVLHRLLGLSYKGAYDALAIWMILGVAKTSLWLGAAAVAGGRQLVPGALAFATPFVVLVLWLQAVDYPPHQVNYIYPFVPQHALDFLFPMWMTLMLGQVVQGASHWSEGLLVFVGWFGILLMHVSSSLLVFPYIVLGLMFLWILRRWSYRELALNKLVTLALVLVATFAFLLVVRALSNPVHIPNVFDAALARREPLDSFERDTIKGIQFFSDRWFMPRLTGQKLLGAMLTLVVVGYYVRRRGSPALAWLAAPTVFALALLHNPVTFPFFSKHLTYHFGLRYGLPDVMTPPLTFALLLAMCLRAVEPITVSRKVIVSFTALFVVLMAGYSANRLWVKRGFTNEEPTTLTKSDLWAALDVAGDPKRPLLCHPEEIGHLLPALTSMTPYFDNAWQARPLYRDYFERKRLASLMLDPSLTNEQRRFFLRQERVWGALLSKDTDPRTLQSFQTLGRVVHEQGDWMIIELHD